MTEEEERGRGTLHTRMPGEGERGRGTLRTRMISAGWRAIGALPVLGGAVPTVAGRPLLGMLPQVLGLAVLSLLQGWLDRCRVALVLLEVLLLRRQQVRWLEVRLQVVLVQRRGGAAALAAASPAPLEWQPLGGTLRPNPCCCLPHLPQHDLARPAATHGITAAGRDPIHQAV